MLPKDKIPPIVPVDVVRDIERKRNGSINEANALQVCSQTESHMANLLLAKLTKAIKVIKDRFNEIKRPQNEALRQIRELEKGILQPVEKARDDLKQRHIAWRRAEQERIAEEQRIADEKRREREATIDKHAANGHKPPGPKPVIEEPVPLEMTDTTKIRVNWDIEIEDYWKVPKKYIVINEASTRANVRKAVHAAEKGQEGEPMIDIPGVKIVRNEVPVYA